MTPLNSHRGFTLLESLIALVILAGTFSVVWEWFNTAVVTTEKINRAVAMPTVFDQFKAYLQLENLSNTREGTFNFEDYSVSWTAKINRQNTSEAFVRQAKWNVVLFDISATVYKQGAEVTQFSTQHTSFWQKTETMESIFGL